MQAGGKIRTKRKGIPGREGQKTVLLTDDSPMFRDLYGGVLLDAGYRVLQVCDAAAAQRFARRAEEIHLLLVDFHMPDMNGMELAEWFRKHRPDIVALLVSTDEARLDQARHRLPWLHCHAKPSLPEELMDLVTQALGTVQPRDTA